MDSVDLQFNFIIILSWLLFHSILLQPELPWELPGAVPTRTQWAVLHVCCAPHPSPSKQFSKEPELQAVDSFSPLVYTVQTNDPIQLCHPGKDSGGTTQNQPDRPDEHTTEYTKTLS